MVLDLKWMVSMTSPHWFRVKTYGYRGQIHTLGQKVTLAKGKVKVKSSPWPKFEQLVSSTFKRLQVVS